MTFRPGQWVDFYAPGLSQVGGYSICSPPRQLHEQLTFDLAVKLSSYPPAVWLHQQACAQPASMQTTHPKYASQGRHSSIEHESVCC
jgi:hypothetical protein